MDDLYTSTSTTESLDCTEIVLRVITKKKWIDQETGAVTHDAFIRSFKDGRLERGISVSRRNLASDDKIKASFNKTFGLATLHSGSIRNSGSSIDVVADPISTLNTEILHHALIINTPDPSSDPAEAEQIASKLSRQARLIA